MGMMEEPVAEADHEVIRHKKFVMHPMDLDEAILQMDLLGHSFLYVYQCKYRRSKCCLQTC